MWAPNDEWARQQAGPLAPALDWVSSRFGPVTHLERVRLGRPDPAWWAYTADLARPLGQWFTLWPAGAAGTSISDGQALRRALGEIVERWVALNARPTETITVAPSALPLSGRFPRCRAEEDCPPAFRGLDAVGDPVAHVRMQRLDGGSDEWVPAGFLHLGYEPTPPEPQVTDPISTGLAFHTDLAKAIWSGLCEVVERDALMLFWQSRTPLSRIEFLGEPIPDSIDSRLWRLRRAGLTAHLFDMTTDAGIPAVFCVLTSERYPHVTVGASCHDDPVQTCDKAMDEAVSIRLVVHRHQDPRLWSSPGFSWVTDLYQHAAIYADGRINDALDFLLDHERALPFSAFRAREVGRPPGTLEDLRVVAKDWSDRGFTVLWSDLTSGDSRRMGHVVKVVVPEMVPLSQRFSARWLDTPRLVRYATTSLGRSPRYSDLARHPHPFA